MKSPFKVQPKITQGFGLRPEYYSQFGLKGHEGLDLIPDGSDWTVVSLEDGVVVKDEDNAKSGAYGINVTIWSKALNKAFQYCHLESNTVTLGQAVKKGDVIGKMGATGNTQGAHLHLNMFITDDNGIRQNRDNGYFGGVNPEPYLQESEPMATITQKELDEIRTARDQHYNDLQKANETIKNLNNRIAELEGQTSQKDTQISSLQTELSLLKDQIKGLANQAKQIPQMIDELEQHQKDRTAYLSENESLRRSVSQLQRRLDEGKPKSFIDKLVFLFS